MAQTRPLAGKAVGWLIAALVVAALIGRVFGPDAASWATPARSEILVPLERPTTTPPPATVAPRTVTSSTVTSSTVTSSIVTPSTVTSTTVGPGPPAMVEVPAPPDRPVRMLVLGDSTAFYIGHGLARWAFAHPAHAQVDLLWSQGFGLLTTGTITAWDGRTYVQRSAEILDEDLPAMIDRVQPDVVVVMVTVDDVLDRVWDDAEGELSAEDARWQERLQQSYRDATVAMLEHGVASVVWIIPPAPVGFQQAEELGDPTTFEVHHQIIRRVVDELAPATSAIDLHRWMVDGGHDRDETWRPDGTHLTAESASSIADMMLGATLVNLASGP